MIGENALPLHAKVEFVTQVIDLPGYEVRGSLVPPV